MTDDEITGIAMLNADEIMKERYGKRWEEDNVYHDEWLEIVCEERDRISHAR